MFNFKDALEYTETFLTMTFVICLGPVLVASMIVQ